MPVEWLNLETWQATPIESILSLIFLFLLVCLIIYLDILRRKYKKEISNLKNELHNKNKELTMISRNNREYSGNRKIKTEKTNNANDNK